MRISRQVAATAVLLAALLCTACQRSSEAAAPRTVSVEQLWRESDQFVGERVRTHGILRVFEPGTDAAYLALDDEGYRVGVQGVSMDDAQPLVSKLVNAEGVLRNDPGFGIVIQVDHLAAAQTIGP
jgi:hypothetical protein